MPCHPDQAVYAGPGWLGTFHRDGVFVTYGKPHHAATKDTLARWVKNTMSLSGVDTAVFLPSIAVGLYRLPQPKSPGCSCTLYYIQANGPQNLHSTSSTSARLSGMIPLVTRNLQIVYWLIGECMISVLLYCSRLLSW